jgi:phosphoribosylformylglycinamidine synthase PurS subunit
MITWLAEIRVMLKPSVNDPQGLSIKGALQSLGFAQVATVRAGKLITVELAASTREEAEAQVAHMCEKLLANPVIETYEFALEARTPVA